MNKEFTVVWEIENYSINDVEYGDFFKSPEFNPNEQNKDGMCLFLYPQGNILSPKEVVLEIHKASSIFIKFHADIINADGEVFVSLISERISCDSHQCKLLKKEFVPHTNHILFNLVEIEKLEHEMQKWPEDILKIRLRFQAKTKGLYQTKTKFHFDKFSFMRSVNHSEYFNFNFSNSYLQKDKIHQISIIPIRSLQVFIRNGLILRVIGRRCEGNFRQVLKCKITGLHSCGIVCFSKLGYHTYRCWNENWYFPVELYFNKKSGNLVSMECYSNNPIKNMIFDFYFSNGIVTEENPIEGLNLKDHQIGKRNIFTNAISSDNFKFADLLLSTKYADVELRVDNKLIPAHRCILLSRSPKFSEMIDQCLTENVDKIIDIFDMDLKTLNIFLEFIYTGNITRLEYENVLNLLAAAKKYQMPLLEDKCSHFLISILSVENACDVLELISKIRHRKFKQKEKKNIRPYLIKVISIKGLEWTLNNYDIFCDIICSPYSNDIEYIVQQDRTEYHRKTLFIFLDFIMKVDNLNYRKGLNILIAAQKYKIPVLESECLYFLTSILTTENAHEVLDYVNEMKDPFPKLMSPADLLDYEKCKDEELKRKNILILPRKKIVLYIKFNLEKVLSVPNWIEYITKNVDFFSEIFGLLPIDLKNMLQPYSIKEDILEEDSQTIKFFMQCTQTEKLNDIKFKTVLNILMGAKKYSIKVLEDKCFDYYLSILTLEKAHQYLVHAQKIENKNLRQKVSYYIKLNLEKIMSAPDWIEYVINNLELFPDIYCESSSNLKDLLQKYSAGEDISDMDPEALDLLVQFINTGNISNLNCRTASTLLIAANKYKILLLIRKCTQFLISILTEGNAWNILVLASKIEDKTLKQCVLDYIKSYLENMITTPKWSERIIDSFESCSEILRTSCNLNHLLQKYNAGEDISDVNPETLKLFIEFIFIGNISNLNYADASNLLIAANKYQVPLVIRACSQFLTSMLTTENALDVLILASTIEDKTLKQNVLDYIKLYLENIIKTPKWSEWITENSELGSEILCISSSSRLINLLQKYHAGDDIFYMDSETLDLFLQFIYHGRVNDLDYKSALKLIIVANSYQIPLLENECSQFFKSSLTVKNALEMFVLVSSIKHKILKKYILDYIKSNSKIIMSSPNWIEFSKETPKEFTEILCFLSSDVKDMICTYKSVEIMDYN